MADDNAQKLFDRLVGEGADPKEAAKFAGIEAPKGAPSSASEPSAPVGAKRRTVAPPRLPSFPTSRAQRIIFGIMIIATGLVIISDVMSGRGRVTDALPRRMVGGSLAGIMLMMLAVPAPRLAVGFASLAGIGALFVSDAGRAALERLGGIAGGAGGPRNSPNVGGGQTVAGRGVDGNRTI